MDNSEKIIEKGITPAASHPVGRAGEFFSRVGVSGILLYLISFLYFIYIMVYAKTLFDDRERYAVLFLMMSLLICLIELKKGGSFFPLSRRWNDFIIIVFFLLTLVAGFYFYHEFFKLQTVRSGINTLPDFFLATFLVYLVMHISWKMSGMAIPMVVLVFYIYGIAGPWLPGFFYHPGLDYGQLIRISALDIDGIFGSFNGIGATWIAIFVVYAGFIQGFGSLDYILNITKKLTNRFVYGLPQIATISSMIFGTFSGSAGANAAGTGSITIPMMKKGGVPPAKAAAVEAVASTGGQIMPPVMGAVAFVMCDYVGLTYGQIVLAAFPPALIFYAVVVLGVHLSALGYMKPSATAEKDKTGSLQLSKAYYLQGLPIVISLIVLMIFLMAFKYDPLTSGFYFVLSFLTARLFYDLATFRIAPTNLKNFFSNLIEGVRVYATTMAPLAAMICCMGIVVGVLVSTGISQKLSWAMVDLAGGNLFVLLLLIAVVTLLLGLAVSTFVCYIIVVMLAAPALKAFGIDLLASHFCVFYLGIISALTPPVAIAAAITAGIAKAPFLKVCWESTKLGIALYILPFVFVTQPQILAGNIAAVGTMLRVGANLLAICFAIQYQGRGAKALASRILLGVLGVIGIFFTSILSYAATGMIVLLVVGFGVYWLKSRRARR